MQNSDIKRANKRNLVKLLYSNSDWSKQSLAKRLNLSPSVVTRICEELINQKIITLADPIAGDHVGRKATQLKINANFRYCVGITTNEHTSKLVLTDMAWHTLAEENMTTDSDPKQFVNQLYENLRLLLQAHDISWQDLLGIGISLKGKTDGQIAYYGVWAQPFDLLAALKQKLSVPVVIDNGVRSSAIVEQLRYAKTNFVLIKYITAGIGAAWVRHDQVRYGENNNAADFGHMIIDPTQDFCPLCKRRGCLESLISIDRTIHTLTAQFSPTKTPILWEICQHDSHNITPETLVQAADAGSIPVNINFTQNAQRLAQALINAESLLDVTHITLIGNFFDSKKFTAYFENSLNSLQLTPLTFDLAIRSHRDNLLAPVALVISQYFLENLDEFPSL